MIRILLLFLFFYSKYFQDQADKIESILILPTKEEEESADELIQLEKNLLALIQTIKQIKTKKNLFNTTSRLLIAQILEKQKEDEDQQQQQQIYQSKVFRVSSASNQIEIEGLTLYFLGVLYQILNKHSLAILHFNQALAIFQSLYLTAPTLYHPFIISIKSFINKSQPSVNYYFQIQFVLIKSI